MLTIMFWIIWYMLGVAGFIYWWTKDNCLSLLTLLVALTAFGLAGPITWPMGWLIHGDFDGDRIILKRRKHNENS